MRGKPVGSHGVHAGMRLGLKEPDARTLAGALLGVWLTTLLVLAGFVWADQHRALALRLAQAQAETSRLAGLLNALVARVDQAAIALTLPPDSAERGDCVARMAGVLPQAITGLTLVDPEGRVSCALGAATPGGSVAAIPGGSVVAIPGGSVADAPPVSFILAGGTVLDPIIVIQRQARGGRVVSAGLRFSALLEAVGPVTAAVLEDRRGTRVALTDGRVTQALPAGYFPPVAAGQAVALPTAQRVVARVSDDLAVTLDLDGTTAGDARWAAVVAFGQIALALTAGLALLLLLLRLTFTRQPGRPGEPLQIGGGTDGLIDWMSAHPDSPIRDLAARIIEREFSQQQRLELRETLLREVNHRVAGHLQMVVSLLRLQSREPAPAGVADALRRAEHRVNTMALVHQGLQQARRGEQVELLSLLRRVAVNLVEGSPAAESISLHVEGGSLVVSSEWGVPVALVLNEWLTTALQREHPPMIVTISLWREGGGVVLEYHDGRDDGPRPEPLSRSIAQALCAQIGGHIEHLPGRGWRLTFAFDARPQA